MYKYLLCTIRARRDGSYWAITHPEPDEVWSSSPLPDTEPTVAADEQGLSIAYVRHVTPIQDAVDLLEEAIRRAESEGTNA